jgi:arylsulfatase A-like enzyme
MQHMRRGYFAATTFTDTQLGRVIDALAATGAATASRTMTCLWSDHVSAQQHATLHIMARSVCTVSNI